MSIAQPFLRRLSPDIALQEVAQLCSALEHNTVLKELYASNHALKVSDASCFAQV